MRWIRRKKQKAVTTVYGVREPQIFEAYAEALAYAKEAGETAAREKALEQGAIEISDVIFQEEQQNAMAYGMDLFLGSEVHVEVIGKMDFTSWYNHYSSLQLGFL